MSKSKDQSVNDSVQPESSFADKPNERPNKSQDNTQKKANPIKGDPKIMALQIKYSFYKWLLGTFLIGAFTAITTFILKDYQLKLDTRSKESAYLQPYLDNYMKLFSKNTLGYDRGADMAKFLSCAVVDKDYKAGWNDLYAYCRQRIHELKAQNDSITRDSITKKHKIDLLQNQKTNALSARDQHGKLHTSSANLLIIQDSINKLTNEISFQAAIKQTNLAKIDPVIPPTGKTTQAAVNQQVEQPVVPEYALIEDSVMYIPKNKGQTFNGNFDITVWDINVADQTVNVRFAMVEGGYIKTLLKDNLDLKTGDEQTVFSPDRTYKYIVLVKQISRNGKNFAWFRVQSFIKK